MPKRSNLFWILLLPIRSIPLRKTEWLLTLEPAVLLVSQLSINSSLLRCFSMRSSRDYTWPRIRGSSKFGSFLKILRNSIELRLKRKIVCRDLSLRKLSRRYL